MIDVADTKILTEAFVVAELNTSTYAIVIVM